MHANVHAHTHAWFKRDPLGCIDRLRVKVAVGVDGGGLLQVGADGGVHVVGGEGP